MLPVRTTQISLAHLMQHLANHSTYHRGQVSLMMRKLAAGPVASDFACFYSRDAARQPVHGSLLNEDLIQPKKLEMGISHRTGGRTGHFDWGWHEITPGWSIWKLQSACC
jgi:DinB family